MLIIKSVDKNSIGEEIGLEKGDSVIQFDGFDVVDILDYLYYDELDFFTITILTKDGERVSVEIEKTSDESLGLCFENDGLDIKLCHNNCIFCFVKQMPKGMRDSLYVKDDDYRQSFLYGNFVTLTNLTDSDIDRIIRLKLSPLYISVQTMDKDVRNKMLNNKNAYKIVDYLQKFEQNNIEVNAQIVLVPNVNDGEILKYSLNSLYKLKNVKSVAVVPCGITKYRQGLFKIDDIDCDYAKNVIELVNNINEGNGGNLVQLADEFYFKANMPLPSYESYGQFLQIENGVGMSVKFKKTVQEIIENAKQPLLPSGKYLTICGTSVYNFMLEIVKMVEKSTKGNAVIKLLPIENVFFGKTVNCTGLLTGGDIVNACLNCDFDYDTLLIPNNCLRDGEDVFLDDMTIEQMSEKLKKKVVRARLKL